MKKITKYLILFIFIALPLYSVSAFELTCDEGNHEFEEFFYCRLNGVTIGETYDTLSGTITTNEYVSCLRYTDGDGLVNSSTDNREFSYTGKPTSENISIFRCQVIKKAESDQQVQIFINDFKSHTRSQTSDATEEIVRSNYISIPTYVEKTTTVSTKPRDTSNSNSRLKALAEDNLNITFSGFITEYNAEVVYEVESLNIKTIAFNSDASVRIVGSQTLTVGLNVIDVYVTSPDGSATTCYTLNVTRLEEGESVYYPESDASLKSLTVTGYTIGFDPEVSEYKIHLDNQTSQIEVNATPTVDTATVNISNTTNLVNGSVVSITITSEDLSNETKYKIIITKDAPKKDYTTYIILGVLVVLGLIVVIVIIYTNKKNKKDPLLRLKNDKRKVNYGKKANESAIPEAEVNATNQGLEENPEVQENSNPAPNVIKADSVNIVTPMQMTEKVADPNLNKITTNTNALDLTVSAKAMPQAVPVNPSPNSEPQVNPMPQNPAVGQVNTMPQNQMVGEINPMTQNPTVNPMPNNQVVNQAMPNQVGIPQNPMPPQNNVAPNTQDNDGLIELDD